QITDPPEHQRAKRPNREANGESRQSLRETRSRALARKELRRDNGCETTEDVEVVPLDHRPDRGRGDDLPYSPRLYQWISRAEVGPGNGHARCHYEDSSDLRSTNSPNPAAPSIRIGREFLIQPRSKGPQSIFGIAMAIQPRPPHIRRHAAHLAADRLEGSTGPLGVHRRRHYR